MQEHLLHPQPLRQGTGVLAASPTEAAEHGFTHVMALLDRDAANRLGHPLQGQVQSPLGRRLGGAAQALAKGVELRPHNTPIQRLIRLGAKHRGELLALQPPEQEIGVGDGQGPTAAIASRTGIRPRRLGTDPQAHTIELEARSTAGGHGVNRQHRRLNRQPLELHLLQAGPGPIAVANVGRRPAHVKTDDAAKARLRRRAHRTHQPPGRPGQDRVLGAQRCWGSQDTTGLHHPQRHMVAQGLLHLLQIALQHRTHGGLQHRGLTPRHQARQGTDLMGERDLLKAKWLQPGGKLLLMAPIGGAMQQGNSNTAVAVLLRRLNGSPQFLIQQQGLKLLAIGRQAALNLNHPALQRLRTANGQGKEIRPMLISNRQ